MPRAQTVPHLIQAGDYLVRKNDEGRIVLSVLWYDSPTKDRVKDGHYCIEERNQVRSSIH